MTHSPQSSAQPMSRPDAPLSSLPMIDEEEVQILAQAHGSPIRRHFDLDADLYMVAYRWREDVDRRAEVVFAIQHENGEILLHTKAWYQPTFFRLPSGGIGLNESVEDALYREIAEETGLTVTPQRFLGLYTYDFHFGETRRSFASYVFHLTTTEAIPHCADNWEVAGYSSALPNQMGHVADMLRRLEGKRKVWGQWRALCHDLIYETLG
ncbi:MAG: NUDIX hydrolase [Caldilineaceae bacterium]|nr:NUDIX hydrolase [Caldilineaceae bacterium]